MAGKIIHAHITSCISCPFHALYEMEHIVINEFAGYAKVKAGAYCIKQEWSLILPLGDLPDGETFNSYFQKKNGSNFPDTCPLPDAIVEKLPSGKRKLEL